MMSSKTRSIIVAVLSFIAAGNCVAGEIYDERAVIEFDNRKWVASHASANQSEVIVEYLLENENFENWTEMVTSIFVPVLPEEGVISFTRDHYKKNVFKSCAQANWKDHYVSGELIISSWDESPCLGSEKVEYDLACFMSGVRGIHTVLYAAKDARTFKLKSPAWEQLLQQTDVFVPNESKANGEGLLSNKKKMVAITYRFEAPFIKSGEFASWPKEIWRSGVKYFRILQPPNFDKNFQELSVSSEPDLWNVDLVSKTGTYMVDPGPTFKTICPIFSQGLDDGLFDLEFGKEQYFFEHLGARRISDEVIDSKRCEVYELSRLSWILKMYVRRDNGLPLKITRRGPDGSVVAVIYDEYTRDLDLDIGLFSKPSGIKFEEQK